MFVSSLRSFVNYQSGHSAGERAERSLSCCLAIWPNAPPPLNSGHTTCLSYATMSAPKDIPGANAPPSTPPLSSSNPFKRLVRSLSRSRGNNYDNAKSSAQTPGTPPAQAVPGTTLESIPVRSSSKRGDASAAAALSTSPPPGKLLGISLTVHWST